MPYKLSALLCFGLLLYVSALPTQAQTQAQNVSKNKAAIEADSLSYDEQTDIVTARGNVKIFYQGRSLTANEIEWQQAADILTARHNVVVTEIDGTIISTDETVLSDKMREAIINRLRVLLPDKSRITGATAVRKKGTLMIINKAGYTACQPCADNPDANPSWEIKTSRSIHDDVTQTIIHEDARIELMGVPIFYLPYLAQAAPDVKKRSGVLSPSFGTSSDLGSNISLPYFINLAPNYDLTVKPSFYSNAGAMLGFNFRHLLESGTYNITGNALSVDQTDNKDNDKTFRGNVKAEGKFSLKPNWYYGFQIEETTDETFLRRYDLSAQNYLESFTYLTHLQDKTYFDVRLTKYSTTLASIDEDSLADLMPHIHFEKVLNKKLFDGFVTLESDLVALQRERGSDMIRLINEARWERHLQTRNGVLIDFFTTLRGDIYSTSNLPTQMNKNIVYDDNFRARGTGYAGTKLRYPLVKYGKKTQYVIEPIVQLLVSPNVKNDPRFPNEDSRSIDLDSTNLFEVSRFSGYDLYESGARVDYGIKYAVQNNAGQYATLFFGQSQRRRKNDLLSNDLLNKESGLEGRKSDYVFDFRTRPIPQVTFSNRLRLSQKDFEIIRSEADMFTSFKKGSFNMSYVFLDRRVSSDNREREELQANASYRITDNWHLDAGIRQDIYRNAKLNSTTGISYRNDCLHIRFGFVQDYVRDRNIPPTNSFNLTINFKTLGSAATGSNLFGGLR